MCSLFVNPPVSKLEGQDPETRKSDVTRCVVRGSHNKTSELGTAAERK